MQSGSLSRERDVRDAYAAYSGELYGFAMRSLGDSGLAEEAVQETFLRAWRAGERFDPKIGSLRTWLFAILRNVVIDLGRARAVRPGVAEGGVEPYVEPLDEALTRGKWRRQCDGSARTTGVSWSRPTTVVVPTPTLQRSLGFPRGPSRVASITACEPCGSFSRRWAMKTDSCRDWRASLGAYSLGHLSADERAGLEAHLEGCPDCRAEVESLTDVAQAAGCRRPRALRRPAPKPSPELGERIAATIGAERKVNRRRRQRRFGFALSGGLAATAAILAIAILPGGDGQPEQRVEFASVPRDVKIWASLEPHAFGTEIHMYVKGVRSGTLCQVFLKDQKGASVSAGTFRYRWGDDSQAVLSSALDISSTEAIEVRAGGQTFVAPVDPKTTTS